MGNHTRCGSRSGDAYAVAEIIIDTIKDLYSAHEQVTPELLHAALFGRRGFADLFQAQVASLPEVTSMPAVIDSVGSDQSNGLPPHILDISGTPRLEEIRRFFLELLTELKSAQALEGSQDLQTLVLSIEESKSSEGIWSHRGEILGLLQLSGKHHTEERKRFAGMLLDMGTGLLHVERYLAAQVSEARHDYSVSQSFNDTVENQIYHMAAAVDGTDNLSDLAHFLGLKLSDIREIVDKKRRHDEAQLKKTSRRMKTLESSLKKMSCEVSKAREEVKGLKEEIMVDPLTRIGNRRAYEHRIQVEWERFRTDGRMFALLLIDIDHFKLVNDTHGHWVGDRCLSELAGILKTCLRDSDFLARHGGEEFVAILPGTSSEHSRLIAERLRSIVQKTRFMLQDKEIRITASIGGALVLPTDTSTESIFNRADAALYQAKGRGRNRFVLS